jgi:exodeoxyribonuclease VII large subunit
MFSLKESITFQQVLTVAELTSQIRLTLEEEFIDIHVVGEISNAKIYPSGHWYFSLKDKEATLPCVSFKNANQFIKFRLEDGLMVVAHGRLSVYPPRGAYQMMVTALEPVGIGDWQLAFEQLKTKLDGEGLFALERKRPIPLMPKRIGVVTSSAGDAIQDILSALARRNSAVSILVSPCRVQGEGSENEIAQAIEYLAEIADIEVILVARGGGSIEDLWAFNTEVVARAVANCKVPIISGVGHETDVTICDFVADIRAPTPTAAAEMVARGREELMEKWLALRNRLEKDIKEKLLNAKHRLMKASPARYLTTYQHRLQNSRLQIVNLQDRMFTVIERILSFNRFQLQRNLEKVQNLGPINVLKRGFSIVRKLNGEVVRQPSQCKTGEILEVLLAEGKLAVKIEGSSTSWNEDNESSQQNDVYRNIVYKDSVYKNKENQ